MAVVTQPLASAEARGSVGGLTYNTWRGRHTVKTRTAPAYSPGGAREAQKNIVQAAGQRWQTLTDEQRAAWTNYANLHPDVDWTGQPKRLAGYHWYVRIQTRLKLTGLAYIDEPPVTTCHCDISALRCETWEGSFDFIWTPYTSDGETHYYVELWLAGPFSAGRHPTLHDAKRKLAWVLIDEEYVFHSLTPGYYTGFARPIRDNGVAGPFSSCRGQVT
jgi:hypothetical protein